jgi:sucrose-6-phosphate hydrolase SacC (GH32 family)
MVVVVLLAAPALAVAQSEWVDGKVNPVVPPPDPGDWDGHRYPAGVVKVDGTYHLYYIGQLASSSAPDDFQDGHAWSLDGVDWELDPTNPVLRRGDPGEWDDVGAALGAVIHDGVEFRLWYGGADGAVARVGYATSMDGSVWTKDVDNNPIIDVGPPGSFDDTFVCPGSVIFHDGRYRMWYFAGRTVGPDDYDWRIGYAWSDDPDGLIWTKHPEPVLGPRPGNARMLVINLNVVFDGFGYHIWYTTDEDTPGTINIAYAVSPDGIEWTRYPWNPVVGGYSGQPAVLRDQDSGEYTMWYADHPGLSFRRATSECCPGVFYDGFEFGDTSAWTVTVP